MTYEQKCIVGLFKELMTSGSSLFSLKNDFTKDEVDDAIKQTIADALRDKEKDCSDINIDNVVVHGIPSEKNVLKDGDIIEQDN